MSKIKHKIVYCFRHITQVPKNINESPKPFRIRFLETWISVFAITLVYQISWSHKHHTPNSHTFHIWNYPHQLYFITITYNVPWTKQNDFTHHEVEKELSPSLSTVRLTQHQLKNKFNHQIWLSFSVTWSNTAIVLHQIIQKLFLRSTINVNKIRFNLPVVHLARTHYSYLPTFSSQFQNILLCSIKLTKKKLAELIVWYRSVDQFKQSFNTSLPNNI